MAHFEHDSPQFGYLNLETLDGVQSALVMLGFDPGASDGVDGPKTRDAIRAFQARASIRVDGIIGSETRQALVDELARRVGDPASPAA